jgi:PKD repeat protein
VNVEEQTGDCNAAFEWEVGNNLNVHFFDQSDDDPDISSWQWNFGDGHSSDDQDPVHTYGEPGVYVVCLIVTNEFGCVSDVCHEVHVELNIGDCEAAFEWEIGNNLNAHFFDDSDDDPDLISWSWSFGDGHTSNDQNPVHTYAEPGVYTVCLLVENEFGCVSDICHQVTVEDNSACEAAFEWFPGNGPLQIQFHDLSDDNPDISSWHWTFGDGHASDDANPLHTYAEPGVYVVCLIVTNEFGCVSDVCHEVHVEHNTGDCEAAFEWDGSVLVYHFIDQSDDDPDISSWQWNFGDGHSSTEQNPVHTYAEPGVYVVCLIVENEFGCISDVCHEVHVQENTGDCEAAFEWEGSGLIIHFIDHSDDDPDIVSWIWNFGDGHIGDGQNPHHTYGEPGVYVVCLTVTNEFGCVDEICHEVHVEENTGDCEAAFEWEGSGLIIHFIDQSDEDPDLVSWLWNFGDGHFGEVQNPVHTYGEPGVYVVCLTVTNEFGCVDDICHEVHVEETNNDCDAEFTWEQQDGSFQIHFTDQSDDDPDISSWHWNFGDGHGSELQNPDHTYSEPGVYVVCLIVENEFGCVSDVCHEVHVEEGMTPEFLNSEYFINLYFTPESVTTATGAQGIQIGNYTNPVTSNIEITYELASPGSLDIEIYTLTGEQKIVRSFGPEDKGKYRKSVNVEDLDSGMYMIVFTSGDQRESHMVVKMN